MTTYQDLKNFFKSQDFNVIIVSEAETRRSIKTKSGFMTDVPAGGVAVALDPIARAAGATYIGRARKEEEREPLDANNKMIISDGDGDYTLKRLFIDPADVDPYYHGFSNQTLWPLSHVAFEKPVFKQEWFDGYKRVNQQFADSIKEELTGKKTFVWIHDYQLSLVPKLLGKQKNVIIGMFWHIPWPTWEVFRILPWKKEILESMLTCDYLAFHRGYQSRNFINTVEREFETRVDQETNRVFYNKHVTTVDNLPLGIDVDVIVEEVKKGEDNSFLTRLIREMIGIPETETSHPLDAYFEKHQVILGVDRLDYTKGLSYRLNAIDRFFEKYPQYVGKVIYLGIIAPSREAIPSYKAVKKEAKELEKRINEKYKKGDWKPIHLINQVFPRDEVLNFYKKADICLVTPLDDGMNLVSKEFVIASSVSDNPGMLILSQFAGSSIDLTDALIVNPYSIDDVADAIKKGLTMEQKERVRRTKHMAAILEERNVYEWAEQFFKQSLLSLR